MPRPGMGRVRVRGGAPSPSASVTPESQAKLPEILALPPDNGAVSRLGELGAETPGGALALIEVLGGSRDAAAVPILAVIASEASEKELRKAARRALHRLRSAGIEVSVPVPTPVDTAPPVLHGAPETVGAWVSPVDGVGSRLLWLLLERLHGGMLSFNLVINDIVGLKDVLIEDTTHRRFERKLTGWREQSGFVTVAVPPEYGRALLAEALALNTQSGFHLPREFVLRRSLLGELPEPPADALIHQHVSKGQMFLLPNLVEESPTLLETEPELAGWGFAFKEISSFAREYLAAGSSTLIITSEPSQNRQERVLDTAMDTLFTPALRRSMRRRLEEMAYIFWETGRERAARQAVAAAFAINDQGSVRSHPFLRTLTRASIEIAIEAAGSGQPLPTAANRTAWDPV